jgi:type VI secretion system (T6SS) effector Hcp
VCPNWARTDLCGGREVTRVPTANGSLNAGQTVNFTATSLAPVDHDTLTAFAHDHSGPQLTYLLKVDGVKGDSTLKGYEGAFTVDEFTFNELTKSSTSAGGGGGAGKAQFDPLTVDIGKLSPGLAALLSSLSA